MMKRISLWGAGLLVIVLAAQFLLRDRSPPESAPRTEPPRETFPPVDPPQAPTPGPPSAEPAPPEAVARNVPARSEAQSPAATAPDGPRRFMYNCGDGQWFGARVGDRRATVFSLDDLDPRALTLPQTEAASGSRYAAGDAVFWTSGDVATFEIRGQFYADCVADSSWSAEAEARRRGVTFRARGNEPSWLLEITPQLLVLAATRRAEFAYRAPTIAGARSTYRTFAGTQELVVVIDRIACNDSMGGELFDNTVAVTFEGTTVYGCGRVPRAVP